jgi:hypothetical protein
METNVIPQYQVKVNMSLCLTNHHAMKTNGGVEVYRHAFLTFALDGGEWSASRPGRFTPREIFPGTHRIGYWVDQRTCWKQWRFTNPGRVARSIVQASQQNTGRGKQSVRCGPEIIYSSNMKLM